MIRTFHFFDVVEATHRYGIRTIRQAPQYTRHDQTDIAGIIRLAEGFPLDVLSAVKVITDIFNGRHVLHVVFQEEFRAGRTDKRHMCSRRHFRDVAQQGYILRRRIKFVSGNQRSNRLATRGIILINICMFIQPTLDDFRAIFKVLTQVFFRHIQEFNFHVLAKIGFVDKRFHTAPQTFYRLKVFMMHNSIKLTADLVIQFRDMVVNQVFIEFLNF